VIKLAISSAFEHTLIYHIVSYRIVSLKSIENRCLSRLACIREAFQVQLPRRKIWKLAYCKNYSTASREILQYDKDHQIPFVGGPNTQYLSNSLIDRHEIWRCDASWLFETHRW